MINGIVQKTWTYKLSASSLTITNDFGLVKLSIVLQTGTGTILGSELCNGIASVPIDLVVGQPILVLGDTSGVPISDYTITTTGIVALIGQK
jgi:hypothetical protein